MPKLLWVALPLLAAAVLVALQMLRRRPPSRHALNVWLSVLLLAYVLTTAGLGIFWVANQQLPVFDWHYLFGYGTVLLVMLHLAFNFRVVWRHFARRVPPAAAGDGPGRRGALGAAGFLLASGAAFALGMRHGRSELRLEASPPGGADAAPDPGGTLALVERFHAFSAHSRSGVLLRAPGVDWGDPPPAFKHYRNAPRLALPERGMAPATPFDLAALGAVLWHTSGVTDRRTRLALRASPSSGALFSTELYVAARAVHGLAPGLWHYDPQTHALEQLPGPAPGDAALGLGGPSAAPDAAAVVVASAVFRRSGHKYRDRTYRYVLADLGHALENLRVAAGSVGLHAAFVAGFDESRAAAVLGLDEAEEGVLALAALQANGSGLAAGRPAQAAPPGLRPNRLSSEAGALGVTAAVHAATSLRAASAPAAAPPASADPASSIALPTAAPTAAGGALGVIAARRSIRRYAATPLAPEALSGVLAAMSAHDPVFSAALRVHVVVHAVAGIPPGAYRYQAARHALLPSRAPADLRAAARGAALDQDVIGDAAAVFVLSIERAVFAADAFGPARGYRHAFLEAGLAGERIYLDAGARGLGVCAVGAFYDDEASALVAVDPAREWIVHFAALGVPAG